MTENTAADTVQPPVDQVDNAKEGNAKEQVQIKPNRGRKSREGLIVSTAMEKTVVVSVVERVRHQKYGKTVQRTTRFHAHNEQDGLKNGDRVRIVETRPISKLKRWRVAEVLERAK